MKNKIFAWYRSTPLWWRRFFITILVPVQEYIFLEPFRNALNAMARFSPKLAIASLPFVLVMGGLTAAVICLFVLEFFAAVGSKTKNKAVGWIALACIFAWVILPLHVITFIGDK